MSSCLVDNFLVVQFLLVMNTINVDNFLGGNGPDSMTGGNC